MYLKRWTIDELTESTATVLRSQYSRSFDIPAPQDVRKAVENLESELTTESWSEEEDFVLSRDRLADFIREAVNRSRPHELPEARDLRDGDVYWIISPQSVPVPQGPATPDGTDQFLAGYREPLCTVWDVTAAARQAAKVTYFQAIERTREKQERRRPTGWA